MNAIKQVSKNPFETGHNFVPDSLQSTPHHDLLEKEGCARSQQICGLREPVEFGPGEPTAECDINWALGQTKYGKAHGPLADQKMHIPYLTPPRRIVFRRWHRLEPQFVLAPHATKQSSCRIALKCFESGKALLYWDFGENWS